MTRRATALGLAASVLVHVLLALLDPRLPPQRPDSSHRQPIQYQAALIELTEKRQPAAADAPGEDSSDRIEGREAAEFSAAPTSPAAAATAEAVPSPAGPAPTAVRDRLAYRASAVWRPRDVEVESYEACRQRERAERLEREIADPRRGNIRLPTDPPPPDRLQAGIRITVGPRRDPPPVGIPAPALPDSLPTPRPHGEGLYRYELPPVAVRRPPGCDPAVSRR